VDLRDSVAAECLAEMALQLAEHRLRNANDASGPGPCWKAAAPTEPVDKSEESPTTMHISVRRPSRPMIRAGSIR
jgi:hypothetical protein